MYEVFKPTTSPAFKILVVLSVALLLLAMITDRLITVSEDKDFHTRFEGIEIGMEDSLVLSLLGTPDDRSSEFYLGQKEGFEEAYRRLQILLSDPDKTQVSDHLAYPTGRAPGTLADRFLSLQTGSGSLYLPTQ
jgi:hypothetical protein